LGDAGSPLGQKQSRHHAQRRKRAIGWNEDRSDVEENWMHLSQNTSQGLRAY
jgi:hypothetical protein